MQDPCLLLAHLISIEFLLRNRDRPTFMSNHGGDAVYGVPADVMEELRAEFNRGRTSCTAAALFSVGISVPTMVLFVLPAWGSFALYGVENFCLVPMHIGLVLLGLAICTKGCFEATSHKYRTYPWDVNKPYRPAFMSHTVTGEILGMQIIFVVLADILFYLSSDSAHPVYAWFDFSTENMLIRWSIYWNAMFMGLLYVSTVGSSIFSYILFTWMDNSSDWRSMLNQRTHACSMHPVCLCSCTACLPPPDETEPIINGNG